jgi:NAD(P)-dependent dehydrogenase (short-subunit alcohol dehydrogenase family)
MLGRDRGRLESASTAVAGDDGSAETLVCDLSSLRSVRDAATEIESRHGELHVLVNNAAVYTGSRRTTADGLETMFATNHLGPFLLTDLLLDTIKASAPARIVNITAPSTVQLDFDDLQGERRFRALHAFGATKMCNLLFTFELARRLEGSGVSVNAVHPGLVRSNLMREAPLAIRWMTRLVSSPPEKAAKAIVSFLTSPDTEGVTGTFLKGNGRPIQPAAYAQDRDVQQRLWEVSAALTSVG